MKTVIEKQKTVSEKTQWIIKGFILYRNTKRKKFKIVNWISVCSTQQCDVKINHNFHIFTEYVWNVKGNIISDFLI